MQRWFIEVGWQLTALWERLHEEELDTQRLLAWVRRSFYESALTDWQVVGGLLHALVSVLGENFIRSSHQSAIVRICCRLFSAVAETDPQLSDTMLQLMGSLLCRPSQVDESSLVNTTCSLASTYSLTTGTSLTCSEWHQPCSEHQPAPTARHGAF